MTSPFTIREEQPDVFRVYVYHVGLYPTGTREDAERLLRSLEHERARTNAAANAELEDLRALLARGVELFGGARPSVGETKGEDHDEQRTACAGTSPSTQGPSEEEMVRRGLADDAPAIAAVRVLNEIQALVKRWNDVCLRDERDALYAMVEIDALMATRTGGVDR